MHFFRWALLLSLMLSFKGYALSYSDFYDENDQLIEVLDPPFFDYECEFCLHHWINKPKISSDKFGESNLDGIPHSLIPKKARAALLDAIAVYKGAFWIPPPYYWKGKKTYGFKQRWFENWRYGCFKRVSDECKIKTVTTCVNYTEYHQKFGGAIKVRL